eukprot:TRINITY_DN5535_c0_g1_i1.p2 TRINITY_DN5535_c0_g1~~TRINITY_DN5535_c0_g1_i1.p2  ORF type:complete len:422 (-),score=127.16 TRINITY_DN5535_c0_g1_i1:41-1246(-)
MASLSLSAALGLHRRREEDFVIPDSLACRNDMTLAQKQRLTMMAKMGVVPESMPVAQEMGRGGGFALASHAHSEASSSSQPNRLTELLRRDQRQREGDDDEADAFIKRPRAKATMGFARLGASQARDDKASQSQEPRQLTLKISKVTAERAARTLEPAKPASSSALADARGGAAAGASSDDDASDVDAAADESEEQRRQRQERDRQRDREKRAAATKLERERLERQRQQTRRKRKHRGSDDSEDSDWAADAAGAAAGAAADASGRPRDDGASARSRPRLMQGMESVKGKVSNDNRNLTDADLERRFSSLEGLLSGLAEGGGGGGGAATAATSSGGPLMSEEEVLRMIRREKVQRGGPGDRGGASASRRVQRELDEWANQKAAQRARVKSPSRFERMVLARK